MRRVLVVGQLPPPIHGQAVMIERLVRAKFEDFELIHVPMHFSRSIPEVGRFRPHKLVKLVAVVARIWWQRIRKRPRILLYPPAGPNRVAMYRDFAILLACRWMFDATIFHFHAGGLSQLSPGLNRFERALFRRAYGRPSAGVVLSKRNPQDAELLEAERVFVVPYGIEDVAAQRGFARSERHGTPDLLFVGGLTESKGVLVLIEAAARLAQQGRDFTLTLVGEFASAEFERQLRQRVTELGLGRQTRLPGGLTGDEKWSAFEAATLFCFPTYYEAETFGLVVLEAMQFELPVVATDWRGVPDLVRDGENGFLVPVRDVAKLADRIASILDDLELAASMGRHGRARYLEEFTLDRFVARMEVVLRTVASRENERA